VKKRSHRDGRWLNSIYKANSTKVLSRDAEPGGEPESDGGRVLAVGRGEGEPDGEPDGELVLVLGLEWE